MLPQSIQARALGNQGVEVEVGAAFQALRADDKLGRDAIGIREQRLQFLLEQPIAVERPHSPGEQHRLVAELSL